MKRLMHVLEARAIHDAMGGVPVTAPKSYFGNLGAAGGAVEMGISMMALQRGVIPPTLNCDRLDPNCPVDVIRREPLVSKSPTAMLLNWTSIGQAIAVVLDARN